MSGIHHCRYVLMNVSWVRLLLARWIFLGKGIGLLEFLMAWRFEVPFSVYNDGMTLDNSF